MKVVITGILFNFGINRYYPAGKTGHGNLIRLMREFDTP
jgi:hypothetical protein